VNAIIQNVDRDDAAAALARVITAGDLSRLSEAELVTHYNAVCESVGLNPLTRPLEYLVLNGKKVLYARKDCTDQLRAMRKVSVQIVDRTIADGLCIVTARASLPDGRHDEEIGAVPLGNVQGEARANAMMKAMTKAKRRVTLSICGLGFLDESEIEGAMAAAPREVPNLVPRGHDAERAAAAEAPDKAPSAPEAEYTWRAMDGRELSVSARTWAKQLSKALAHMTDADDIRSWRFARGALLMQIHESGPEGAALVAEAERAIDMRIAELQEMAA
jgi:hypothetical protein